MDLVSDDRWRFGVPDLALYLSGVAGLATCLTLVFLAMRAVMNVGGFCAEGGPYVIETACPEGVPLVMVGGIFGLFGFGGLMAWKGSLIGSGYGALVALAWPALFLSLGWNFLEYGLRPPEGEGMVLGWLLPGVIFMLMGGLPLLAALPIGHSGRAGAARSRVAERLAPRPIRFNPIIDAERAEVATLLESMRSQKVAARRQAANSPDLVTKLERLAELRRAGDLTDEEFEMAKWALLGEAGSA
ncbi:MAG: SHOCT domain-containing protein [Candidatus Limnocylindrales bacterium]